jgi:NADH-ubiquinone oxidoreductase chain 4
MLTCLILIPLIGCIVLLFIVPNNSKYLKNSVEDKEGTSRIVNLFISNVLKEQSIKLENYDLIVRKLALFISILAFIFSSIIWGYFDTNDSGYQFISYWPTIFGLGTEDMTAKIGIDSIGLVFILLTTYIMPVAILSAWDNIQHDIKSQLISLLAIESILITVFSSLDLISFYVSFEAVLIPLYFLIGSHGSTSARLRASMLLFLYTLGGSLVMLIGLIYLIELKGSSDLTVIGTSLTSSSSFGGGGAINTEGLISEENIYLERWIWLAIFVSLSIKAPIVPVHIWLKTVHAEAPLSGSIVLAGLVLKLSVYGYLRILLPLLPEASNYFSPFVMTLGVITIIHGALVTLRQVDTKAFVAQSSVSHMGTVILGLGASNCHGLEGAILLSIAHGLVSPALFILVGGVLYDRYHSRTIRYYRGLGQHMPSFKLWLFLATCANMGVPSSLNWISELLCFTGAFEISPIAGILAVTSVFLGAVYSIWLYVIITGGGISPYLAIAPDMTHREKALLIYLIAPTIFLGLFPSFVLDPLYVSITSIAL